jgi:uncharacterized membrane protein (DUF485 family)
MPSEPFRILALGDVVGKPGRQALAGHLARWRQECRAAFVIVNAVRPEWMAARIGQLNLATVYGFGLIIFALILALIYNGLSGRAEAQYAAMFEDEIANVEDDE